VVGNYPKIPNFPRPPTLKNAIQDFDDGKISIEKLKRIEDQVTTEVMKEQIDAGVDIITDGQIGWDDEITYLAKGLKGFEINGLTRFFDTNTYYRMPIVKNKIEFSTPITVEDYKFAARNSKVPVKVVITGPYTTAKLSKDEHYNNFEKLTLEIARALKKEVIALKDAGTPMVQINEPSIVKNKKDFPIFENAVNELLDGVDIKTALYTYFGDVDRLLDKMQDLPTDIIGLDFVMGKKNFALLKEVDFTKSLGMGIVDARNTKLEEKTELKKEIGRILEYVKSDKLFINPNCGLDFLPRETAFTKLKNMVDIVKSIKEGV
jgi:5-methyltetrahydropteroyltriglutamate--homocysteine methyltransferase